MARLSTITSLFSLAVNPKYVQTMLFAVNFEFMCQTLNSKICLYSIKKENLFTIFSYQFLILTIHASHKT